MAYGNIFKIICSLIIHNKYVAVLWLAQLRVCLIVLIGNTAHYIKQLQITSTEQVGLGFLLNETPEAFMRFESAIQ